MHQTVTQIEDDEGLEGFGLAEDYANRFLVAETFD
jgi:hypothetical protein